MPELTQNRPTFRRTVDVSRAYEAGEISVEWAREEIRRLEEEENFTQQQERRRQRDLEYRDMQRREEQLADNGVQAVRPQIVTSNMDLHDFARTNMQRMIGLLDESTASQQIDQELEDIVLNETQSAPCYCVFCQRALEPHQTESYHHVEGSYVCNACYTERYFECDDCHHINRQGAELTARNGHTVCEQCRESNYFFCYSCEDLFNEDEANHFDNDRYCLSCYDELDVDDDEDEDEDFGAEHIYYRGFDSSEKFLDGTAGKIVKSKRIFSTEIECQYPNRVNASQVTKNIPKEIGVADDGSISGGRGLEFQTPKLKGKKGEDLIKNLCSTLIENKFKVDKSCGLHVHLDGQDFLEQNHKISLMWAFYIVFEDVLLSFLPVSRRKNNYCRLLKSDYHFREIVECQNTEAIEKLWYRSNHKGHIERYKHSKYHNSRYAGINLHSLLANGHLEVRYHSGTLNASKILEWANLHARIMDCAHAESLRMSQIEDASYIVNLKEKTEAFFAMLKLPEKSVKYFSLRQETFADKKSEESTLLDNENPTCAE